MLLENQQVTVVIDVKNKDAVCWLNRFQLLLSAYRKVAARADYAKFGFYITHNLLPEAAFVFGKLNDVDGIPGSKPLQDESSQCIACVRDDVEHMNPVYSFISYPTVIGAWSENFTPL